MNSPFKWMALAAFLALGLAVPYCASALTPADVPPPPDVDQKLPVAGSASGQSASSETGAVLGVGVEEEAELVPEPKEPSVSEAAASLKSLEEAYEAELDSLRQRRGSLKEGMDALDDKVWSTRKKVKSFLFAPKVAIHGLGKSRFRSRHLSGNAALGSPDVRTSIAYLDLQPEGVFSKELFWTTCFRLRSDLQSTDDPAITMRRLGIRFNPPWFSLWVGDFDESYTPLTMWNRNNQDLRYTPKAMAREDRRLKYDVDLDREPAWPFRGVRVGTRVMWPDSKVLSSFSVSTMAHMIRNGFDDNLQSTGWYFGHHQWAEWIFAAQSEIRSAKLWWGQKYLQLSVSGQGALLNQLRGTDRPGATYVVDEPSTWAHGYRVGSVKPDLQAVWGNGHAVGAEAEVAFGEYHDDLNVSQGRNVSDYAILAGPYVRFGKASKLSLRYLDVGPYYYSPLAQARQDAVTSTAHLPYSSGPDFFDTPLRSQNFLSGLGRPDSVFTYYDRMLDNTFPYGLATPNRRGFGGEVNVAEGAFKMKGSAYWVEQITSDLTFNATQTGYIPVDDPDGTLGTPKREFLYANVGPTYDLGPALGFGRTVELGANARFERTKSSLGTLETWFGIVGLRVGALRFWEVEAAACQLKTYGFESTMDGTRYARASYLFENQDLGHYSVVRFERVVRMLRLGNVFRLSGHSDLLLDWAWSETEAPVTATLKSRLCNQFVGLTYEIRF